VKAIALILCGTYIQKRERRREDTGEAHFLPASNPGWANRGHTNWAPPICHTGVVRVVPPVCPIANTSLAAMFQQFLYLKKPPYFRIYIRSNFFSSSTSTLSHSTDITWDLTIFSSKRKYKLVISMNRGQCMYVHI
jgi:hypothetical protein